MAAKPELVPPAPDKPKPDWTAKEKEFLIGKVLPMIKKRLLYADALEFMHTTVSARNSRTNRLSQMTNQTIKINRGIKTNYGRKVIGQ
jgi:hypothetical protein